jgi:hypothetical protein
MKFYFCSSFTSNTYLRFGIWKQICENNNAKPKYLISDQGTQFVFTEFRQ